MIAGTYNAGLVALSILIAMVASYAAFNLGERVSASGGQRRWIWLTSGAIAMGFGMWSMHYVGMLAFVLPVPVLYHVPTVILSLVAAVTGAAIALCIVSKKTMRRVDTAIAGVCLGGAIVAMHYVGMAAMRSAAMHHYKLGLVTLSVVVAVTFSSIAAWLAFRFGRSHQEFTWTKLAAASLMGVGIASMHYTAMAAAYFMPGYAPLMRHTVEVSTLGAFGIGMTTLLLLGTVLVTLWFDRRLANERLLQHLYGDLQEREAKIRRLVDANIIGIFIWNLEGKIIEANEAFLHMVEYGREDLVSGRLRWTDLTPAEWRERDERFVAEVKATGTMQPFEKEFLRKDGSRVPVLVGSASFEGSGNEGVAFVLDLSEQKRAEEALRRSEAYLAEAQRLTRSGSWAWNVRTDALFWSQETFRIYDFDPGKMKPTWSSFLDRVHPEDRPGIEQRAKMESTRKERVDSETDFRIVLPDGTIKHLHSIAHPVMDESDEINEIVGTVMDVTERKRAEEERERLRQAQADLAHVTRITTMGELTASLAHEIKQPISAAVTDATTCLRWLGRDQPDLAEAREAASRIIKDVTRASDIISRINLLFKKGSPQRELLDVNEVIQEMIGLLRSEASRYSISIHGELANDLPKAMADRVQLQQVLMNLMLNAIEAMKDMSPVRELTIRSQQDDNRQLLISVNDTGLGLQPEQAEQIFNAFFTTKPQGTGMGLTISRSIVESHGGRLWVTATSGSGATFQFTLPSEITAHQAA
jgi:PAS domain S-box-containing protein